MALLTLENFKRVMKKPALLYRYPVSLIASKRDAAKFISAFFSGEDELIQYRQEVIDSKIIEQLNEKENEYNQSAKGKKTYRGNPYCFGGIRVEEGIKAYSLIRKLKPKVLIETGVCNGLSTSFILLALHKNNDGKLYSIDYPEIEGIEYKDGDFWEGERGAVIPKDKQPGWIIPDYLRGRWELILGKTQDKLPQLLEKLGNVDFYFRDSEHSYECMTFEFNEALNALNNGGILISDDINENTSFQDFCKKNSLNPILMGSGIGLVVKQNEQ